MKIDDYSLNSDLILGQVSAFRGPPEGYCVMREFFAYQVPVFSDLAAGASVTNQLQFQADSDFEWTHGQFQFDLNGAQQDLAGLEVPNMSILIVDSGSGRQLMSAAVPVQNLFGYINAGPARALPCSRVFKANSNASFTATNFDAATATGRLRLTLLGWKLYYFPDNGNVREQAPA